MRLQRWSCGGKGRRTEGSRAERSKAEDSKDEGRLKGARLRKDEERQAEGSKAGGMRKGEERQAEEEKAAESKADGGRKAEVVEGGRCIGRQRRGCGVRGMRGTAGGLRLCWKAWGRLRC